jgi:hypothetical protein
LIFGLAFYKKQLKIGILSLNAIFLGLFKIDVHSKRKKGIKVENLDVLFADFN